MEEQNNSVTTALYALKGEIGIVFTQLQNLTSEIGNLKQQNEDRRNSMEKLAQATRNEIKTSEDSVNDKIIKINSDYTELKTQFGVGKWVVAALVTTVVALAVSKMWTVITTDFSSLNQPYHQNK
jgi:chromosome segregation ATPase